MLKILKFFFICALINSAFSWKSALKWKNGNGFFLGEPSKTPLILDSPPEELWFGQVLDHFDYKDSILWKQRYYVNDNYYASGGPVFLMIGGEGEATAKWMHQGAWIHYAKKFNALCFQLEHRFYGKSQPESDISTKSLFFLASEQALADLANFIASMNKEYNLPADIKWIVFGGSYPGSLAAWAREKYPHLIHGAISSSGPLLAEVDFYQYYDVVKNSLEAYSEKCSDAVHKAFDQVENLLKHRIGNQNLNDKFKLCDPIEDSVNNKLDIWNFYESLADNFAGVVQYNKDNSPHATITIDDICNIMINETIGPQVTRLASVNALLLKTNNEACLDYKYQKMIDQLKNTSLDSEMANGGRQWMYQTCTEFGFYQTSRDKNDLFGGRFSVDLFISQCEDIFSSRFDKVALERAVNGTNLFYGGLNPKTTNVLYIHGSIDPWHALGLTESKFSNMPTIYIKGTAHCANMYEPRKEDSADLVEARIKIESYISELLKKDI